MKRMAFLMATLFIASLLNAQVKTVELKVKGIACDECVKSIKTTLTEFKEVKDVKFEDVNFEDKFGIVKVSYSPALDPSKLSNAIEKLGFDVQKKKEKKAKVEGKVVNINVSGITCGGCVKEIKSALTKVKGVKKVEFKEKDFKKQKGLVQVVYSPDVTDVDELKKAITSIGFGVGEENKH